MSFFVIEGGEGSGKGSVMKALASHYPSAVVTREPGGTDYAEQVRNLALHHASFGSVSPITAMLAMFSARFDHVEKTIAPALKDGRDVFVDRFDLSTYCYQVHGEHADLHALFWHLRLQLLKLLPNPIYLFLDVAPAIGLSRNRGAGREIDNFEARDLSFHTKVRDGSRHFLSCVPYGTWRSVDASQELGKVISDALATVDRFGRP